MPGTNFWPLYFFAVFLKGREDVRVMSWVHGLIKSALFSYAVMPGTAATETNAFSFGHVGVYRVFEGTGGCCVVVVFCILQVWDTYGGRYQAGLKFFF